MSFENTPIDFSEALLCNSTTGDEEEESSQLSRELPPDVPETSLESLREFEERVTSGVKRLEELTIEMKQRIEQSKDGYRKKLGVIKMKEVRTVSELESLHSCCQKDLMREGDGDIQKMITGLEKLRRRNEELELVKRQAEEGLRRASEELARTRRMYEQNDLENHSEIQKSLHAVLQIPDNIHGGRFDAQLLPGSGHSHGDVEVNGESQIDTKLRIGMLEREVRHKEEMRHVKVKRVKREREEAAMWMEKSRGVEKLLRERERDLGVIELDVTHMDEELGDLETQILKVETKIFTRERELEELKKVHEKKQVEYNEEYAKFERKLRKAPERANAREQMLAKVILGILGIAAVLFVLMIFSKLKK